MRPTRLREILQQDPWLKQVLLSDVLGETVMNEDIDAYQMRELCKTQDISFRPWSNLNIENGTNFQSVTELGRRLLKPLYAVHHESYRFFYFINGKYNNSRRFYVRHLDEGCQYPPDVMSARPRVESSYPLRVEMVKLGEETEMTSIYNDDRIQWRPEYFAVIKMTVAGIVEPQSNATIRRVCENRIYEIYKAPADFQPRRDDQDVVYFMSQSAD